MKFLLKVLLSILGLAVVIAISGGIYFNSNVINSEKIKKHKGPDINEITFNGYAFRDLNRNGELDIYEDKRKPLEDRANDLLSQMTLDEKIRLLKGSGMKSAMGMGP